MISLTRLLPARWQRLLLQRRLRRLVGHYDHLIPQRRAAMVAVHFFPDEPARYRKLQRLEQQITAVTAALETVAKQLETAS